MANSFLEYRDQDLRLNDLWLALIFSELIRFGRKGSLSVERAELFDSWEDKLRYGGPGLYNFNLGDYWSSQAGQEHLLELTDLVAQSFAAEGNILPAAKANSLLLTERFDCVDLETSDILAAVREIQRLIGVENSVRDYECSE